MSRRMNGEGHEAPLDSDAAVDNSASSVSVPQNHGGDQTTAGTAPGTKSADQAIAHGTIKILAYLLADSRTEGAGEKRTLARGLMHLVHAEPSDATLSQQANVIEMMGTTCGVLEMMFRHSIADRAEMYESMGSSVILLLLQVIDRCLPGDGDEERRSSGGGGGNLCFEGGIGAGSDAALRGARDCVDRATEIFCHFARVPEARRSMANLPGLLTGALTVAESRISEESRANALWVVANLACAEENLGTMASHPGLLDVLVSAAAPEAAAEPGFVHGASAASDARGRSRKQAVRALMNLSVSGRVRARLGSDVLGLAGVMLDVLRWGDRSAETRGFAAATLANIASAREDAAGMIGLGDGSFLSELGRAVRDDLNDDLTVSYCLETLRLLAADDSAVDMCCLPELLETLVDVAASGQVGDKDSVLAASTLKRLSKHVNTSPSENTSGSTIHSNFVDSLVRVIMGADSSFLDVQGRIGEALATQSLNPLNRAEMMRSNALFDALNKLSAIEGTVRCASTSLAVLRDLAHVVQDRALLATDAVVETLANLICRSDLHQTVQDEALKLIAQLASTAACRRLMCRNERLMVALVRKATESWGLSSADGASTDDLSASSSHSRDVAASIKDTIVLLMSVKEERDEEIHSMSSSIKPPEF